MTNDPIMTVLIQKVSAKERKKEANKKNNPCVLCTAAQSVSSYTELKRHGSQSNTSYSKADTN